MCSFSEKIKQWKIDYPFLTNIWTRYEEFDKPVNYEDEEDADYNNVLKYENTCKVVIRNTNDHNKKYNDFCIRERCNSLNYWLYYMIGELKFSKEFASKIFEEAKKIALGLHNIYVCDYTYNEKIKDPEKIIKLLNFHDNIDKIQGILKGQINDEYCYCEKYINQCVNIYKNIKSMYCSGSSDKQNNSDTCTHVQTFETTYTNFLVNIPQLHDKVPSLMSSDDKYVRQCKTDLSNPNATQQENQGTSKEISLTNTVATIGGVSSVLAMLYKFTPAGRWINSGLLRNGRSINTNLYTEGASELLLEKPLHEDINSYNIGYEVA
ncbi:Plasmodium vivax Vir protein, putative [Plasmodium vivax]|nr:Plasmodium vivax Vir protein, putative [Plasmodium vivax]